MEQNSWSKNLLEALSKIPCIINIKWSKDYKVFVDIIEDTTEGEKEYIKKFLLAISNMYEVVFRISKKKKWWQKLLSDLRYLGGVKK